MFATLIPLTAILSTASANCAYGTSSFPREPQVAVSKFSYDALTGPLNWYGLNETANYACDNGTIQSPIVIDGSISLVPGSSITTFAPMNYPNGTKFENLGTNVEVVVNGTLIDGNNGVNYSLAQFHFHTPGEHRISDEFYPMEMHWVFESAAKQYAVIAFIVELCEWPGCIDPVLESVFAAIDSITEPGNATLTGPLDFTELVDKFLSNDIWRYSGSLTTPPCSEQVNWLISTNILSINLSTWLAVKKVIKYNARYTQDVLNSVNLLENAAQELGAGGGTNP